MAFHTITQADLDEFATGTVSLYVNDVLAVVGTELNNGDSLRAVITGNWDFKEGVELGFDYDGICFAHLGGSPIDPSRIILFTVDETKKIATASPSGAPTTTWYGKISVIEGTAPPLTTTASNNVYLIDNDKLKSVVAERFVSVGDQTVDNGQYILGVKKIPFNIDPSIIREEAAIKLGNTTLTTKGEVIANDRVIFDLGEVHVSSTHNNLLDWVNTKAYLHLPFSQQQEIDLEYVLDCTIKVKYFWDAYTGNVIINVFSEKQGVETVISSDSVDIGVDVPFMGGYLNAPVENANIDLGGDNTERNVYIELIKDEAILTDKFFTIPVVDESILSGYNGYCEVEKIDLNSTGIKSEKEELLSILKNGVIIK